MPLIYINPYDASFLVPEAIPGTFIGASNVSALNNNNTIISKPAGTIDGDFMILFVTSALAISAAPAGWTQNLNTVWTTHGYSTYIFTKIASSEPSSYTMGGALYEVTASMLTIRGPVAIDILGSAAYGVGTLTYNSINTSGPDRTLITYACDRTVGIPPLPAGQTSRVAFIGTYFGTRIGSELVGSGETGNRTSSAGATGAEFVMLALR